MQLRSCVPAGLCLQLVLGTGCMALAVLYWKSKSTNKALATRLAQRDAELADLVSEGRMGIFLVKKGVCA